EGGAEELRRRRQRRGKPAEPEDGAPGGRSDATRDITAEEVARALLSGPIRPPADAPTIVLGEASPVALASGDPSAEKDEERPQDASDSSLIHHASSISSAAVRLPGQSESSSLSESGRGDLASGARLGHQVG